MDYRERAIQLAKRPYAVLVVEEIDTDGNPLYVAYTPEIEGCFAQGETVDEAHENLFAVRVDFIENLLIHRLNVPSPYISSV